MAKVEYAKGLEGVIAAESKICKIDGEKGLLHYMGYLIEDLVKNTTYEEVTYLLLYGELPTGDQLAEFSGRIFQGILTRWSFCSL
jgi:citrate synthase